MPYIGKQPIVGNFQVCDAISVVNGQAAYTMQVASANVEPENANHMLVSLNGVLQKPGSSFTISGATITFASNLATGDVIDFILLLGDTLNVGTPSDDTVGAAQIKADLISGTTALTSAPDDTDEFLVSDAGTLKRIDYSLIKGGGKVLQVLNDTATSAVATTAGTSTFVDTGLSQAITPSATSSKILCIASLFHLRKTGDTSLAFRLVRDSTNIITPMGNYDTGDSQQLTETFNFQFLDSPNTTSSTTYKIQYASGNGNLAADSCPAQFTLMEIGA